MRHSLGRQSKQVAWWERYFRKTGLAGVGRCHCRQGSRDRESTFPGFCPQKHWEKTCRLPSFSRTPWGGRLCREGTGICRGLGPELEMGKYLLCLSWRRWIFNQEAAWFMSQSVPTIQEKVTSDSCRNGRWCLWVCALRNEAPSVCLSLSLCHTHTHTHTHTHVHHTQAHTHTHLCCYSGAAVVSDSLWPHGL